MKRPIHQSLAAALSLQAILVGAWSGSAPALAQTLEWTRQLGTSARDVSYGVSADGLGNVYISGYTDGSLDGTNAGRADAFLSKYDASGALEWTQQFGTSEIDNGRGVSADGLGNVYISGNTGGSLGGTTAGDNDAFLSKYDASGALQWPRQLGTSAQDESASVSADGLGNVYISGYTFGSLDGTNAGDVDAFLSKYDASGALQWTRQSGTSEYDSSRGVSADGLGNVYISGNTDGDMDGTNAGGRDAFLSKYDADGMLKWTRQLGTSGFEESNGVSADGLGNVYISGPTSGNLASTNAGGRETFLSKYDASGALQWTQQFDHYYSRGVSADGLGNVYISGASLGSLDDSNAFLSKYDAGGALAWTRQLGTSRDDVSVGVSADGLGNVYISGETWGDMAGTNAGSGDAFVAKYGSVTVPEPSSLMLVLAAFACSLPWRRRTRSRRNSEPLAR